jgi:hypothetical protein
MTDMEILASSENSLIPVVCRCVGPYEVRHERREGVVLVSTRDAYGSTALPLSSSLYQRVTAPAVSAHSRPSLFFSLHFIITTDP